LSKYATYYGNAVVAMAFILDKKDKPNSGMPYDLYYIIGCTGGEMTMNYNKGSFNLANLKKDAHNGGNITIVHYWMN